MVVLAVSCHPDDIEFGMAGTMFLLKDAGCEIHYVNVANGCAGSLEHTPEETAALDDYRKKVEAEPPTKGAVNKVIFWSREKAQDLLTLAEITNI